MTNNELVETLVRRWRAPLARHRALYVAGAPGGGKTSAPVQAAAILAAEIPGFGHKDYRLAQLDEVELRGTLAQDHGAKLSEWYPPAELPAAGSSGIMVLDELPRASRAVRSAVLQLLLERKLGTYSLPDGWMIVACGNRREDNAGSGATLDTAENGRFRHVTLDPVQAHEWCSWATAAGVSPLIRRFIEEEPAWLWQWKPDGPAAQGTPRTWHAASDELSAFQGEEHGAAARAAVDETVGEACGAAWGAWMRARCVPTLDAIAADPHGVRLPDGGAVGEMVAVEILASRLDGMAGAERTPAAAAVAIYATRLAPEACVGLLRSVAFQAPDALRSDSMRAWARANPDLLGAINGGAS